MPLVLGYKKRKEAKKRFPLNESETEFRRCRYSMISPKSDDIFVVSGSSAKMHLINARTNRIVQEYHPMKDERNLFWGFPSVAFASAGELLVSLATAVYEFGRLKVESFYMTYLSTVSKLRKNLDPWTRKEIWLFIAYTGRRLFTFLM